MRTPAAPKNVSHVTPDNEQAGKKVCYFRASMPTAFPMKDQGSLTFNVDQWTLE